MTLSRRTILRGGAILGAGAALGSLPFGARRAFANAATEAQWPRLTSMIDGYVGNGRLAGAVAAMGWGTAAPGFIERGRIALGPGAAPADPDGLYRVYSMTKPITGMAAMMLIDEGKLGLDQPLADLLPNFARMQVQVTPDGSITDLKPAVSQITIRHLLTHTAGLGYSIIQQGPIKAAYEAAGCVPGQVTRLPIPGLSRAAAVQGLANFADRLSELPLVYEPGTKWSYSVALDLMGRVIEVASGQPFDAFLQDRIFGPCGMTSSWFQVPQSAAARLTTNYGVLGGALLPIDPGSDSVFLDRPAFPFGGAGLVSSPRDYDRFLMMLAGYGRIGNTRVMSELAVRVGTSNLLPESASLEGTMVAGAGFGAGGRVGLADDLGTYGWGGAAGTVAFVNLRHGVRGSFFTQYMPSNAYPLFTEFPQTVQLDLAAMRRAA
jgi:CubicO group peptidase (beta-lactamase class C family)